MKINLRLKKHLWPGPGHNRLNQKVPIEKMMTLSAERSSTGLAANGCCEPRAAGLKSRPSLMQQIDSPNRSKSCAAMQREKPTLVATAARSEGSMTELRDNAANKTASWD